jgi:hypothetical protein
MGIQRIQINATKANSVNIILSEIPKYNKTA